MVPRRVAAAVAVVVIVLAVVAILSYSGKPSTESNQKIGVSGLGVALTNQSGFGAYVVSFTLTNHYNTSIQLLYVTVDSVEYQPNQADVSGLNPIYPGQSIALKFSDYSTPTLNQSYNITIGAKFEDGTVATYSATISG